MNSELLADLVAEHEMLDAHLVSLSRADWARATPAEGWSIADTVQHLTVSESAATAALRENRDFNARDARGVGAPGEGADPGELLAAWRTGRRRTVDALIEHDDHDRVPWGGRRMAARSLATARLMETWAHGLDCLEATGTTPLDTDRLVHIAWLGWRTLPYAFGVAGVEPPAPPESLRLELTAPSGGVWRFGPDHSPDLIRGPAVNWCRVVTQRVRPPARPALEIRGPLAHHAVRVARAFL